MCAAECPPVTAACSQTLIVIIGVPRCRSPGAVLVNVVVTVVLRMDGCVMGGGPGLPRVQLKQAFVVESTIPVSECRMAPLAVFFVLAEELKFTRAKAERMLARIRARAEAARARLVMEDPDTGRVSPR